VEGSMVTNNNKDLIPSSSLREIGFTRRAPPDFLLISNVLGYHLITVPLITG
jgi:hypothetical protein